jgi:NAD(P)-dependent dehydrogenase (short-subunit alcohol dehydrogenase family)
MIDSFRGPTLKSRRMPVDLPSGRALVIGNSDGIGLALTRRLLADGMTVLGVSRRAAPIDSAAYRHLVIDVSAADYRERLSAFLDEPVQNGPTTAGPLALCVYAAGIGELFDLADLATEAQVFRVNLLGAVETIAVVVPRFEAAGQGHFVGLSSLGDELRSGQAPSYSASKAGLSAYLINLGLALAPRGIAITNLRFGFVDTKMAKAPQRPFMIAVERAVDVIYEVLRSRPLQRSHPWRMAALVRLLAWLGAPRIWFARTRRRG